MQVYVFLRQQNDGILKLKNEARGMEEFWWHLDQKVPRRALVDTKGVNGLEESLKGWSVPPAPNPPYFGRKNSIQELTCAGKVI